MIALQRPLVFLDLETTGTSPMEDRIIDVALIKTLPQGGEESFCSLVDPGIPIPPESTAIHHITDDMVRGQPSFAKLAPKVLEFLEGADLAGFGVLKFDLAMLAAEFKRWSFEFSLEGRRVVDALTIFHRQEPRNLTAAYKFYCGKPLADAHRAEADARASAAVLWAQLERYKELPQDLAGLHAYCSVADPRFVDKEGKFVWRNGEAAFNFGKHRTLTLREVVSREPSYIQWLMKAERTTPELAQICREALAGRFPAKTGA